MKKLFIFSSILFSIFSYSAGSSLRNPEGFLEKCARRVQEWVIVPWRKHLGIKKELGKEYPHPNEARWIDEAIATMLEVQASAQSRNGGPTGHGLHQSTIAIVRGEVEIDLGENFPVTDIDPNSLWGKKGKFPFIGRFSMASPFEVSQTEVDFIGFAMRIFIGEKHIDLLMTNKPVTTGANLAVNTQIQRMQIPGWLQYFRKFWFLVRHPITALLLRGERHQVYSLAEESYHSGNAVRIGSNHAMVFLTDSDFNLGYTPNVESLTDDHLTRGLSAILNHGPLRMGLFGGVQVDPYLQDVEDGTIDWLYRASNEGDLAAGADPNVIVRRRLGNITITEMIQTDRGGEIAFDPYLMNPLGLGRGRQQVYRRGQQTRRAVLDWGQDHFDNP